MEAVGGIVGVMQDQATMALRPKVGWAVRPVSLLMWLIDRIRTEHVAAPRAADFTGLITCDLYGMEGLQQDMPTGMGAFYHEMDGAALFSAGERCAFRIVPHRALHVELVRTAEGRHERVRFCELPDGRALWVGLQRRERDRVMTQEGVVIAASFEEFLHKALDSGGVHWW